MKKNIFIVAGLLLSVGSVSCSQTKLDQQLINAAQNNNVELVNTLLKKGASVNATDSYSYGNTALTLACIYGYYFIVVVLLTAPEINVNATDSYGNTALTLACIYGYTPIVAALLAAPGIKVTSYDVSLVRGEIHSLINSAYKAPNLMQWQTNNKQALQQVQTQNLQGLSTDLIFAAKTNNLEFVKILLTLPGISTSINFKDQTTNSALSWAVYYGYEPIVAALLAASGIIVSYYDVSLAPSSTVSSEIVQEIKTMFKPYVAGLKLIKAVRNNNLKLVNTLLTNGANVNVVDIYGSNALYYAVYYGRLPIVEALLATPGIIVSSYNVNLAKAAADSNKTMKSIYRLINSAYNAPNLTQWQSDNKQILQTLKNQ